MSVSLFKQDIQKCFREISVLPDHVDVFADIIFTHVKNFLKDLNVLNISAFPVSKALYSRS